MIINNYDWDDYINKYDDLKKKKSSKEMACKHWIQYGKNENRVLKLKDSDFNWITYIENYKDLQDAQINTYDKAYEHWVQWGKNESRTYDTKNNNTNEKILLIIALHTNNSLKYKALINNLKYFERDNIDIVLINSAEYKNIYNYDVSTKIIDKIFIPNDKFCDFGKWLYLLKNKMYVNKYKKIIFTNDSYIITDNIDNYLNNVMNLNYDLYGYNDSSEIKYHYQSYLFSIDRNSIAKYINFCAVYNIFVNSFYDLIIHYELNLLNYFDDHKCYLKIADKIPTKNIFFTCDGLYEKLLNEKLLPFIKIKRISDKNPKYISDGLNKNNFTIH